jgi:hypothetical protein
MLEPLFNKKDDWVFSNPAMAGLRIRFHPHRLGRYAPLSFSAYGGKIQTTRSAGGR